MLRQRMSSIFERVLTSLSSGDDIVSSDNSRNGVGLNWSWAVIAAELDVLDHDWVETSVLELQIVSARLSEGSFCLRW